MPSERGRQVNWYNRYWHDWPEIEATVFAVARAHARYLGYEVHRIIGDEKPPGDPAEIGPVMRIRLWVFRSERRHGQPTYEQIYIDVERRAGKFRAKASGAVDNLSAEE